MGVVSGFNYLGSTVVPKRQIASNLKRPVEAAGMTFPQRHNTGDGTKSVSEPNAEF